MILAENLSKKFDDFTAVNTVNLNVKAGQVLVLLGPNGAGKTTTVRMLTSILRPTEGRALVAGFDVVQEPQKVRSSVGVLTEHHGLYGRMNAEEYLDFFAQLYGLHKNIYKKRINELLETFGLADVRTKRLGEYSKGMRQKLALIRALLHNPPVLLFDEPTSAMDPESALLVRDAIRNLRSDCRTILLCTHNLNEAEELADLIAIIRKGTILLCDTAPNIKLQMLGRCGYEARFAEHVDGNLTNFPEGVKKTISGDDWIRFQIDEPNINNPILLQYLIDQRMKVTSFQEVEQKLETAYLEAVNRFASNTEQNHV